MKKIALVNAKGGSGKTTSAILLAEVAKKAGYTVEVWDTDVQGSATEWAYSAEDLGESLAVDVLPMNATTMRRRQDADVDFVFIDTPPNQEEIIKAAAEVADYIIVPTGAGWLEASRAWKTVKALNNMPRRILVTKAEKGTIVLREIEEAIEASNLPAFETYIYKRQPLIRGGGTLPKGDFGYSDVFDEVLKDMGLNHG